MKDQTFTENDIHYFTDSKGRKWAHMPWGMLTGEIPAGVVYPDASDSHCWPDGCQFDRVTDNRRWAWAYPNIASSANEYPQGWFAIIPADRIEVVTEHVEATVMDALQALVESGGKPVEGWRFADSMNPDGDARALRGVTLGVHHPFISFDYGWKHAYRPVTRVRIKPEVKPEPGYGFTLDGNPVPPPPEGWEIVPEGEEIGKHAKFYSRGWLASCNAYTFEASAEDEVRAYARRVVKKPSFDPIDGAFNTYWQGGSKHRAIDAFRAGVKWAKEVRGE